MMDQKKCPQCGVLLGADAPEGLCPGCLMGQGLGGGPDAVGGVQESDGRYVHLGEQGRGGMGRVLLVHDDYLDREIALKELMPSPGGGGADGAATPVHQAMPLVARFLQEARITGQLEHPSIVPVYELGYRTDGTLYYTMKLVRGKTLRQAIAEAETLEKRLKLLPHFVDLCQAVAYAHSRKVIHRDIKPGNVMVGEFGETVVLDWGLAKIKDQRDVHQDGMAEALRAMNTGGADAAAKTAYGHAMGTPSYMPPEQAAGHLEKVDERSDIYALGAVLYEILTGRPPFTGGSAQEILDKVQHGEAESVRSLEPKAPKELVAMCRRAMAKNPAKRYPTAKALAEAVAGWVPRNVSRARHILGATALALIILTSTSIALANWYAERLLNQEVAKIKAQGAPTCREDIEARVAGVPAGGERRVTKFLYGLSPDDFAHVDLIKGMVKAGGHKVRINERLDYQGDWDKVQQRPRGGWADAVANWTPELAALVGQILSADRALLDEIIELSALPGEDPRIALKRAIEDRSPHVFKEPNLMAVGMAANLPLWKAVIALKEGRPDEAMDLCTASVAFINHSSNTPRTAFPVFFSRRLRCGSVALALQVLRNGDVSDVASARFLAACEAGLGQLPDKDAWELERLLFLECFRTISEKWSEPYEKTFNLSWSRGRQYLYGFPTFRFWRTFDEVAVLHRFEAQRDSFGKSFAEDRKKQESFIEYETWLDWTTPIAHMWVPDGYNKMLSYRANQRVVALAGIAAALKKCRRDTGGYPATLSALAPAYMTTVPANPFTGEPFAYSLEAGHLTLSSAGDKMVSMGEKEILWEVAL